MNKNEEGFGQYKNVAIELLKKTISILNEFDVNHCLISGTLLGYVRHDDFNLKKCSPDYRYLHLCC